MFGAIVPALKILAGLVGLGEKLEAWLERRNAQDTGRRLQKADDDAASLRGATDAQRDEVAISGADRDSLIDSMSATPTRDK